MLRYTQTLINKQTKHYSYIIFENTKERVPSTLREINLATAVCAGQTCVKNTEYRESKKMVT